MKKVFSFFIIIMSIVSVTAMAQAYWVWTPETGRFINPKYSVKDTPEDQFDLAMGFYKEKDYKRAIGEFQKLMHYYPKAELAPSAQYYIGRSYEDLEDYYQAFLAYQKTFDSYPFTEKVDEIVEREYRIGNLFLTGHKAKILGVAILPAIDKAIEIFNKVVENAPYSSYAPLAQFKIGEAYKKAGDFNSAILEFQKLLDNYPDSALVDDAKYEIAYATYKASLKPYYDQAPTDAAIAQFEEFAKGDQKEKLGDEAADTLQKLRERKAESIYETAFFYERQKHYESALIYYNEILKSYSDTSCATKVVARVKFVEKRLKLKKKQ